MTDALYEIFLNADGVSIDTREELTNKIFFALPGKNVDSNTFYRLALDKGAVACVVSDRTISGEDRCFYTGNPLLVLQELAKRYRKEFNIPVIAITGSNGKTTTKEILHSILKTKFRTHATSGNYNNHIGLPLTLLSAPPDAQMIILEMGANAPGDIEFLCGIGRPTHGLITSIGRAHLEGFGDLQGVISAKFELFDYLDENSGVRFINQTDDNINRNSKRADRDIAIADDGFTGAEWNFRMVRTNPFVEFEMQKGVRKTVVRSKLTGMHNWRNIMNAVSVGMYFGAGPEHVKSGVEDYIPQNSRSQWIRYYNTLLLLDAYNANPSSVKAMFEDFDKLESGREKYVILGEMAELGKERIRAHEEVVELLRKSGSLAGFFLVGRVFKEIKGSAALKIFDNVEELKEKLPADFYTGNNMVMVKGSRSVRLEDLFHPGNFKPFDNFD